MQRSITFILRGQYKKNRTWAELGLIFGSLTARQSSLLIRGPNRCGQIAVVASVDVWQASSRKVTALSTMASHFHQQTVASSWFTSLQKWGAVSVPKFKPNSANRFKDWRTTHQLTSSRYANMAELSRSARASHNKPLKVGLEFLMGFMTLGVRSRCLIQHSASPCAVAATQPHPHAINPIRNS